MMNCPKCENELREDMFCENCNEYLFNMDKDKKSDIAKSWLKVFGITVGCFALLICILIGVLTISDSHKYNEELNSKYEEICQYISDKFSRILSDIWLCGAFLRYWNISQ